MHTIINHQNRQPSDTACSRLLVLLKLLGCGTGRCAEQISSCLLQDEGTTATKG
jgi:hypothetical protein